MNPQHKTIVITGAARGLGLCMAETFARCGANIALIDLTESDLATAADICQAHGVDARCYAADVSKESRVETVFTQIQADFGSVDVLINNAGVGYLMRPFVEVPLDEWKQVMDVNLTGTFLCSQEAAKHMISAGNGGRIINIASQAAKTGFPHLAAYVATKHGLVGLTRSNACELGEYGITVNAICPNHITTELGDKQNEYYAKFQGLSVSEYLSAMKNRIPMKRHCTVDDVAALAGFLVSDEAAYMTGEALNVSGGEETH